MVKLHYIEELRQSLIDYGEENGYLVGCKHSLIDVGSREGEYGNLLVKSSYVAPSDYERDWELIKGGNVDWSLVKKGMGYIHEEE